jgi:Uma2 family endonuclease
MYEVNHFQKPVSVPLPTMYDLPSEDSEEPGLPDLFHDFQPRLLRETCVPPTYPMNEVFVGADLNLYYDSRHTGWYKRPDWFLCLGVTSGERQEDLRWSYVIWQEGVAPFLVVELLSPGTEDEDLGRTIRTIGKPPTKWEVYERGLRVPFYAVYDRYTNVFRLFRLVAMRYEEVMLVNQMFWFEELQLGLGLWSGRYAATEGLWLRWYDQAKNWVLTADERAARAMVQVQEATAQVQQERDRADEAQLRAERLAAKLRLMGIEPDGVDG